MSLIQGRGVYCVLVSDQFSKFVGSTDVYVYFLYYWHTG